MNQTAQFYDRGQSRRDPFDISALRRDIDRAFEGFDPMPFSRAAFQPAQWHRTYPLVNLAEDRDNLYVEALAPGIEPNSLNITVVQNTLTITGEKMGPPPEFKPEACHREERASGKFSRAINLPVEIDEKGINAEYKNGLLMIKLPKSEKAKPKQINVQVS
jgi:HSP20 family protein